MMQTPQEIERIPKKFIVKKKYDLANSNPMKDFPEFFNPRTPISNRKTKSSANKKKNISFTDQYSKQ